MAAYGFRTIQSDMKEEYYRQRIELEINWIEINFHKVDLGFYLAGDLTYSFLVGAKCCKSAAT